MGNRSDCFPLIVPWYLGLPGSSQVSHSGPTVSTGLESPCPHALLYWPSYLRLWALGARPVCMAILYFSTCSFACAFLERL